MTNQKSNKEIANAFDALGENPELTNITFTTFDLAEGESIDVMFTGVAEDVQLNPQMDPTNCLMFADRNGMTYYEPGAVLKKAYENGNLGINRIYRITFLGKKEGGKGTYNLYNAAELTSGKQTEPEKEEFAE